MDCSPVDNLTSAVLLSIVILLGIAFVAWLNHDKEVYDLILKYYFVVILTVSLFGLFLDLVKAYDYQKSNQAKLQDNLQLS